MKSEVLYYPMNLAKDLDDVKVGRRIYEEFSTAVVLREQTRVTNPGWRDSLVRLRYGRDQLDDLTMLRTLLATFGFGPVYCPEHGLITLVSTPGAAIT